MRRLYIGPSRDVAQMESVCGFRPGRDYACHVRLSSRRRASGHAPVIRRSILTDEDINTIVTPTAPAAIHTGPITRARARQLNYQVLSFLGNDSNVHENMMLPKLDTFVLLTNEGPSLEKDEHWSKNKHGDDGMRKGNKNGVTSDDFRTLKPP